MERDTSPQEEISHTRATRIAGEKQPRTMLLVFSSYTRSTALHAKTSASRYIATTTPELFAASTAIPLTAQEGCTRTLIPISICSVRCSTSLRYILFFCIHQKHFFLNPTHSWSTRLHNTPSYKNRQSADIAASGAREAGAVERNELLLFLVYRIHFPELLKEKILLWSPQAKKKNRTFCVLEFITNKIGECGRSETYIALSI